MFEAMFNPQRLFHLAAPSILLSNHLGTSQRPILPASPNPLTPEFRSLAQSMLEHFHVPSLSIAVVNGEDIYFDAYGYATLPDIVATPETLYFTGSTTKSFTAAALTTAMDDLKDSPESFDWSTPVSSIIRDDFVLQDDYVTSHATLEDLASHRTGLPGHDLSYGGYGTVRDTVRNMRNIPLTADFRTTFQYCNYMWATLGYILEYVTGLSLGEVWESRIWRPLGMENTYYSLDQVQKAQSNSSERLAQGYFYDKSSNIYHAIPYLNISQVAGAGAIISNVLDYAKYLRMMIHKREPISQARHTQLRRGISLPAGFVAQPFSGVDAYGLGWIISAYRGVDIYWHGGGLPGFGAAMLYVPSKAFGVTILGNTMETSNFAEQVLLFALLDSLLGTPENERFDWIGLYDIVTFLEEAQLNNTRKTLYPNLPSPPHLTALPLSEYEGTYASTGYQNLTFIIAAKPNPRIPPKDCIMTPEVLRAEARERTLQHSIELEHVTGEYFLAWVSWLGSTPSNKLEPVVGGSLAEFRIGADGKVKELGIALEPLMDGDMIWFQRVG